jgi:hypothetical protein
MEPSDTGLSEITGMVLVKEDSHVMLTTGITSSIGMFPVFANSTMAVGDVASHLSALLIGTCHSKILTLIYKCGYSYVYVLVSLFMYTHYLIIINMHSSVEHAFDRATQLERKL